MLNCSWRGLWLGEGRELVELVRVVVQYLVHRALVIASVPVTLNVTAWTSAAVIACPGRAFPLSVASIRAMNSSTSAAR